jgi:hypothetical protein
MQHVIPSFKEGYRNGHADALLGLRLMIALTSPHAEYREGYHKAQADTLLARRTQPDVTASARQIDPDRRHVVPV